MARESRHKLRFDHVFLARAFVLAVVTIGLGSWAFGYAPGEVKLIPCLFTAVTGHHCPGCGMTRSCLSLVRGQFATAWAFNPFAFLLVPLAAAYAIWPARLRNLWEKLPPRARYAASGLCLVALLIRWATIDQ